MLGKMIKIICMSIVLSGCMSEFVVNEIDFYKGDFFEPEVRDSNNKGLIYAYWQKDAGMSESKSVIIKIGEYHFFLPMSTYLPIYLEPGTYKFKVTGLHSGLRQVEYPDTIEGELTLEKDSELYFEITPSTNSFHYILPIAAVFVIAKGHSENFGVEIFKEKRAYLDFCRKINYEEMIVTGTKVSKRRS